MKLNKTILQIIFLANKHFNKNTNYGIKDTITNNIGFYMNKVNIFRGLLTEIKKPNFINNHNYTNIYIYDYDTKTIHTLDFSGCGLNEMIERYIKKENIINYVLADRQQIRVYKNNFCKDSYIYINKKDQLINEIKRELKHNLQALKIYKAREKLEKLSGQLLDINKYNKVLPSLCKKAGIKRFIDIDLKIDRENNLFSINYQY